MTVTISLYDLTVPAYQQVVDSMIGVLDKGAAFAAEKGIDTADLVNARLIDDMANLHFQATSVTHHSIKALSAIESGEFGPPSYPDASYEELQAMTAEASAALKAMTPEQVNAWADNTVIFKIGGNEIPFTAVNFIQSFSLPNFYFHATTAYDILRAQGVQLGKLDYLGALRIGA